MHFCFRLGFDYLIKNQGVLNRIKRKSSITSPSQKTTMDGSSSSSQKYVELERTLFTPVDKLEVHCEMLVDFISLADNGFDIQNIVHFQGWVKYFDRLIGPVFPTLVKEFWIHASAYPKVIISSVMGTKLMITEDLIKQLIGYEHEDVEYVPAARRNMEEISEEVFMSGVHSNKFKDLKPHYKIWAKIFLGCIFHRKTTNSPDYINNEQLYLLFCIGRGIRVDLPHFLFDHLHTHVKETREDGKNKGRTWIAMGRLLSDIITETGLVDHLYEAGQAEILKSSVGKAFDGKSLFRLKLIDEVKAEPQDISQESVKKRRIRVEDFPLWTKEEPVECLIAFIAMCKLEGIPLPSDLLEQASRSAPDTEMRRKRKSKKKVVAEKEGPRKRKKKLIIKNRGISISESHIFDSVVNEPTLPQTHTTKTTISEPPSHDQTIPDISEQTVYVSEHTVPETIPTTLENIISEQPDLVTPTEQLDTTPSEQVISDQQPQSSQQTSPDNLDHAENIIFDPPENVISESLPSPPRVSSTENIPSRQSSPLPSPVFDDFSKTNLFSDIPYDKPSTPQLNGPPTDNTSQIVPVVAENLTPLNTLIDLTSDTKQPSPEQHSSDSTSSESSFHEEDFLIHRKDLSFQNHPFHQKLICLNHPHLIPNLLLLVLNLPCQKPSQKPYPLLRYIPR